MEFFWLFDKTVAESELLIVEVSGKVGVGFTEDRDSGVLEPGW